VRGVEWGFGMCVACDVSGVPEDSGAPGAPIL